MDYDSFMKLLPILNATGVPLLAIGIILLLRAYQQSVKAYRESSTHLLEENKRLRNLLSEGDANYLSLMEKMKGIVAKSVEAIEQLQVRKISLLSKSEETSSDNVLADVKNINEAISLMRQLSDFNYRLGLDYKHQQAYTRDQFVSLTTQVGQLAEQIGDIKSRTALVGVIVSDDAFNELKEGVKGKNRGLTIPKENMQPKEDDTHSLSDIKNELLSLNSSSEEVSEIDKTEVPNR
jgi:hypothetical protein